ncbi:MAG: hypothetical protein GF335_04310 [Candidatus Moranbacteria bacterium]|nr:hypothetical protein [Candidatus Moranbacteria bacterium]
MTKNNLKKILTKNKGIFIVVGLLLVLSVLFLVYRKKTQTFKNQTGLINQSSGDQNQQNQAGFLQDDSVYQKKIAQTNLDQNLQGSQQRPGSSQNGSGKETMDTGESKNGKILIGSHGKGDNIHAGGCHNTFALDEGTNKPDGPAALKFDYQDQYKLWYGGFDGANYRIYMAEGDSPENIQKVNNDTPPDSKKGTDGRIPLSGPEDRFYDKKHASSPWVLKERKVMDCRQEREIDQYFMYYGGYDEVTSAWRVARADSSNAYDWKKKVIVISPQNGGGFSQNHADSPAISLDIIKKCIKMGYFYCCIEVNRTYHTWFSGNDAATWRIIYIQQNKPELFDVAGNLNFAESSRSVALDVNPDKKAKDNIHVAHPSVILQKKYKENTKCGNKCEEEMGQRIFHMWYSGYDGASWRIFYAHSKTPAKFQRGGEPVIDIGDKFGKKLLHVSGPMVVSEDEGGLSYEAKPPYRMWFSGWDGSTWEIYQAYCEGNNCQDGQPCCNKASDWEAAGSVGGGGQGIGQAQSGP